MSSRIRIHFLVLLFILISGCAPVISPELRAKVDRSLTFTEVLQNPDAYKEKIVLWGGKIIQVLPQDGTTYVEVLQMPLGWRKKPEDAWASEGKFVILAKELIDLSRFRKGEKVTVVGEIQGAVKGDDIKSLGEMNYRYPVILSKQTHLWKGLYPYSSLPPPVDPGWYNPYEHMLRF